MKNIKLLPFVHKVKGHKNWALYDLYNGNIFQITPEGDVEAFKKQLIELNLAHETEAVFPMKYENSFDELKKSIKIFDLQLRVTGECDLDCDDCGSVCRCYNTGGTISNEMLSCIFKQFEYIPLQRVSIVGGNPLMRLDILDAIKKSLPAKHFCLMFNGDLSRAQQEQLEILGIEIADFPNKKVKMREEEMKVDSFTFFYNKIFNPCWGNKIAIDVDGTIRNCLWSSESAGNISKDSLKRMLLTGFFDRFWELNKDKIDVCRSCEYRYACSDCRPAANAESNNMKGKTALCNYDPITGVWPEN